MSNEIINEIKDKIDIIYTAKQKNNDEQIKNNFPELIELITKYLKFKGNGSLNNRERIYILGAIGACHRKWYDLAFCELGLALENDNVFSPEYIKKVNLFEININIQDEINCLKNKVKS